MDDDAEIVAEFLVESHENLDQLDRDLVELERTPDSRELLSSIFRTIHTIKGTSGFLAFNRLEALTHVGENLLSRLRDGKMTMTTATTGALLTMVDTVRSLLEAIEHGSGDADPAVDVESVVAMLEQVLSGDSEVVEAAEAPVDEAEGVEADGAEADGAEAPVADADVAEAAVAEAPVPEAAVQDTGPVVEPVRAVEDAPPTEVPSLIEEVAPVAAPAAPAEPGAEPAAQAPAPVVEPPAPIVPVAETPAAEPTLEVEPEEGRRGVVDSSVRVDVDLLDGLVQLVGELVLTRNQILQRTETADDVEMVRA
jgi:two-component system, chemotaxis family, sensor kinase CheA